MEITAAQKLVLNVGCGPARERALPAFFDGWKEIRVDLDPSVKPDVIADATDLSAFDAGSIGAIWSAHCIEHLYAHEVPRALAEFYRVLSDDGFACILVPDLQTIAQYAVSDRLHEVVYVAPVGPVTAHDILFGFGPALAQGQLSMAHRCGFTPTFMLKLLGDTPFAEVVLRRRVPSLELAAVARKKLSYDAVDREALLSQLKL
jgi:SAM-dependent methyltransferase